ncbi:CBS domain-containing protein [Chloroflexota bacterium]
MLVKGVMSQNVITVTPKTPVVDAMQIMRESNFRRLPVIDDNGDVIGLVTQRRLETVMPRTTATLMWQIQHIIHHTVCGDVMRRNIITVEPTDTVEYAVAKAQAAKVGTLLVLEKNKLVGICTTNDFFYKIVNPTLGLCMPGTRILIDGGGDSKVAEKIISCINELGVKILLIWTSPSSTAKETDITLQLDTEDVNEVIKELAKLGYIATVRQR